MREFPVQIDPVIKEPTVIINGVQIIKRQYEILKENESCKSIEVMS